MRRRQKRIPAKSLAELDLLRRLGLSQQIASNARDRVTVAESTVAALQEDVRLIRSIHREAEVGTPATIVVVASRTVVVDLRGSRIVGPAQVVIRRE